MVWIFTTKREVIVMSKEKEILDGLKTQLRNAIADATDVEVTDGTEQIYEGRLELAQELLDYIEGGRHV
jgi:hypothetical protein